MKKFFILSFSILTTIPIIGENSLLTSVLYDGMITIKTYEDHYHISFRLPDYNECIDTIDIEEYNQIIFNNFRCNSSDHTNLKYLSRPSSLRSSEPNLSYFSHICFATDNFSYMESSGRPRLPYVSINIPTLFRETEVIVDIDSITIGTITLPFDYYPTQNTSFQDNIFQYDLDYYTNDDPLWNNTIYNSKYYDLVNKKSVSFAIFPLHYNPIAKDLEIIYNAEFNIFLNDTLGIYNFSGNDIINNAEMADKNYFDIFLNDESSWENIEDINYLIVTEQQYQQEIEIFSSYKHSLGYNVGILYVDSAGIDGNSNEIRNTLISIYEDSYNNCNDNYSLKYILLVGDINTIPFSTGNEYSTTSPPTDIYYSILNVEKINNHKNLNPDVYIGRWPIDNAEDLHTIINKTIRAEEYLSSYNTYRGALFSGIGSGEDYFYEDVEWLNESIFNNQHNYHLYGVLTDGRDIQSPNPMLNELNTINDSWMVIYSGHGNVYGIGAPYNISFNTLDAIEHSNNNFIFAFACLIGNVLNNDNFSKKWIGSINSGVGIIASTVTSYSTPDRNLSRNIFKYINNTKKHLTIGELFTNGKISYFNAGFASKEQLEKYNLYADPSLYIYGLDVLQHQQLSNNFFNSSNDKHKTTKYINSNYLNNELNSYIYDINGKLLQIVGYNFTHEDLPNGFYIIIKDNNDTHSIDKLIINQ